MLKRTASLALIATAVTGAFTAAYAQSAVDGAIGGTVEDTSGAIISKATVVIRSAATNAEQTVPVDSSGFFRAIHLQPGTYTVLVNAAGFEAYKAENVSVTVGSLTDVAPKLTIGSASDTVDVTSEAPAINTTNNDFESTIGLKVLQDLPVTVYRWSAYALLTPGVVADSNGFGLLSFRGQSTLLNNITFDGTDDNQAFFAEERGRTRAGYSTAKASIQEFQVNTSNYSVEYGRSAGGVVNAVTRSGSNQLHGEAYFYDRDATLGATNPFTTHTVQTGFAPSPITFSTQVFKPTDVRVQTGIGIGGPIIKDKLFYFFAFDKFHRNFPLVSAPSSSAIFYATVPTAPNGTNGTCTATSAVGVNASGSTPAIAASAGGAVCALAAQLNGTPTSNMNGSTGTVPLPLASVTAAQYTAAYNTYTSDLLAYNSVFGTVGRTGDQDIFFPKIDWQVNPKNHVTAELNRLRWTSPAGIQTGTGQLNYGTESIGNDFVKLTFGVAKLDTEITSHLSNEVRYQYGRDLEYEFNQTPTPYENSVLLNTPTYTNPFQIPPLVTILNAASSGIGTATFLNRPAYPDERRYQISDTLNYVRGNHNIKFGIDFLNTTDLSENLTAVFGDYAYGQSNYGALESYFTDLNKPNACSTAGTPTECYSGYQQGFGPLGFNFETQDYAGFVQDEWKATPRLSLTLGLRYEYEALPPPQIPNINDATSPLVNGSTHAFPDNRTNVGPRVGFAFDVFGTGKTVLRGGYGEFFARLINSTIYNAIAQTGNSAGQFEVGGTTTASSVQFGNNGATNVFGPIFPQIINPTGFSATTQTSLYYFDKNFKMPEIQQADLTVEQDLGAGTTFSLTWLFAGGRRLPDFENTNLPAATATVNYTVVDPNHAGPVPNGTIIPVKFYTGNRPQRQYQTTTDIFSGVNSNYEAIVAQVNHKFNRNLLFSSNYTWSHALDYGENNTTFTSANSVFDPANLHDDYGNSNQNVANRFVAYAIYNTPSPLKGFLGELVNNYEISPSFQAQNGLPYTAGVSGSITSPISTTGQTVTGAISGSINGSGGTARFPTLDRNVFQFRRDAVLDMRISKRFAIREKYTAEILVQSYNLLNHLNVTNVASTNAYGLGGGGTTGSNTLTFNNSFGVFNPQTFAGNANSTLFYSPRQVEVGARFLF